MKKDAIIAALAFSGLKPVPTADAQVVQSTGTSAAAVMSQKATTDALNQKQNAADPAGLADNLTPYSADSGATQSVPFINQGTGCGNGESIVDTGSYAQVKKKLGNTVGVNQQIRNGNFADSSYWSPYDNSAIDLEIANGIGKVTFKTATGSYYRSMKQAFTPVIGHKYLLQLSIKVSAAGGYAIDIAGSAQGKQYTVDTANVWTDIYKIIDTAGGSASSNILFEPLTGVGDVGDTMEYRNIAFSDLTLWFGSNDRIPSDLLSHPENWGRYYSGSLAANPGQLVNADGSVLTSIGRNCNSGDGDVLAIPNQAYYCKGTATITYKDRGGNTISTASVTNDSFTTPADCFSFGVLGTGVTISLYYSGESGYDSDYLYSILAQIDTGSEVLLGNGDDDADTKLPDGTITRKWTTDTIAVTSIYERESNPNCDFAVFAVSTAFASNVALDCRFSKYGTMNSSSHSWDAVLIGEPRIYQSPYQIAVAVPKGTTLAQAQALLDGATFMYRVATPTTEQGTPFSGASADNYAIDDFGSMYWAQSAGVPQGVEIFYPYDYKAAVDTILNEVNGDVTKLVTSEKVPDAPSSNGTYVFKVTVSGGTPTYSWVADE